MGLLGILGLLVAGGSAAKCAAENSSYRNNDNFLLPDGKTRVYIDRQGFCRKMDGTLIVNPAGDRIVDGKGNLIYDRTAAAKERELTREIEMAKKYGYKAYIRWDKNRLFRETVELSTGKVVTQVCVDSKNNKFAYACKGDTEWHFLPSYGEALKYHRSGGGDHLSDYDAIARKYPYARESAWWEDKPRTW